MNAEHPELKQRIDAAKAGDLESFNALVGQFQPMLMAFAAYRIANREEAREAVQDTFVRAYEQLAEFREDGDFGTWLRSICRFMVLSRINTLLRERSRKDDYRMQLDTIVAEHGRDTAADTGGDPLAALSACLQELQTNSRNLIAERYENGLRCKEIAEKTGRTVTWVTSTLSRVRKALKTCVESKTAQEIAS